MLSEVEKARAWRNSILGLFVLVVMSSGMTPSPSLIPLLWFFPLSFLMWVGWKHEMWSIRWEKEDG